MVEIPPFDEALIAFRRFAAEQGFPTDLLWVCREDVTARPRGWCVRVPVPEVNERLARERYEQGRRASWGVCLQVAGRVAGRSACFVWLPSDANEAASRFVAGLTLKVPVNRPDGILVRSRLVWAVCCWLNRRSKFGDYWSFVGIAPASRATVVGRQEDDDLGSIGGPGREGRRWGWWRRWVAMT